MSESDYYLGKYVHENNYRICKKIGYGGFGKVYLAEHQHLEKQVAIKFLDELDASLSDEDKDEAFKKVREEGNVLQRLQHRNILYIEDIGMFENCTPYLILPYAAQGSLRQKMELGPKPLSLSEMLTIIEQAGEALQYMHEHKVAHGDVKPANMLFDDMGTLLLSDMGNAVRLTTMPAAPRAIGGTPGYMAPEQFEGMINARCDQYALGCVVYELLTGKLPVTMNKGKEESSRTLNEARAEEESSRTLDETRTEEWVPSVQNEAVQWLRWEELHEQTRPQRPGKYNPMVPLPIELAILKALAKKPEDRHPDVATFVQALRSPSYDPSQYQHLKNEWIQEGDHLYREGCYPEALEIYCWVGQFATHDPEVGWRIAQVYVKQGQDEQARGICKQIVHFVPGNAKVLLLHAELCCRAGDLWGAQAACAKILQLPPQDWEVLSSTARMLFYQLQQWPETLIACEQILRLAPGDLFALRLKVATLYQLQRYPEVLATCKDVLRWLPEDQQARQYKMGAYSRWGHELFEQKRYQEAGEAYEQAIWLGTHDPTTWHNRGTLFFNAENYEMALASYERAYQLSESCESEQDQRDIMIEASMDMAKTLRSWAKVLRKQGKRAEALQLEEQAAQLDRARQSLFPI